MEKKLIITTGISPSDEDRKNALLISEELTIPFCLRQKNTIKNLMNNNNVQGVVIVSSGAIRLHSKNKSFGFHPNMAMIRIQTLLDGKRDRFLDVTGIKPGDRVLDCTCGMASDALISAWGAGEKGSVTALEASPLLSRIVSAGIKNYSHKKDLLCDLKNRITVINEDYRSFLKRQKSSSWDVICFDPMFKQTHKEAHGLDLVRNLASYSLPDHDVFKEAKRVARRCVVIKDGSFGPFLKKMNIPVVSMAKKVCYGRIDLD